jgi:cell division transport system permease protein
MLTRIGYFARETLVSLRRNLLMTLAGIITVAVSLCVLGGALLLSRLVDHGTQQWKNGVELEIFMNVRATQGQIDSVNRALNNDRDVRSARYLTKEDAYEEFRRLFRDQPDLVATTDAEALPSSYRVAPDEAELTETVAARYSTQPGVDEVKTAQEQVKKLLSATSLIRTAFIVIFFLLLAASLFLIVNTIRLATFARRREIEVMKLVGASNWFVRIPFMLEGLVQGVIGAAFAFGAVWGLKQVITNAIERNSDFSVGFYVTNGDANTIGIYVLLLGAGIGVIGSIVGLRRFLEV